MTPQIFNDIKRIAKSGHTRKSARKGTDAAINVTFQKQVADFVTRTIDRIDATAGVGEHTLDVRIPNLGNQALEREIEDLLKGHLEAREFEITSNLHERAFTVKW